MAYPPTELSFTNISTNSGFNLKDFNDRFSDIKNYVESLKDGIDTNSSRIDSISDNMIYRQDGYKLFDESLEKRLTNSIITLTYNGYSMVYNLGVGYPVLSFIDGEFYRHRIDHGEFLNVPIFCLKASQEIKDDVSYTIPNDPIIVGLVYDNYWRIRYDVIIRGSVDKSGIEPVFQDDWRFYKKIPQFYYIDFSIEENSPIERLNSYDTEWDEWTKKLVYAYPIRCSDNNFRVKEEEIYLCSPRKYGFGTQTSESYTVEYISGVTSPPQTYRPLFSMLQRALKFKGFRYKNWSSNYDKSKLNFSISGNLQDWVVDGKITYTHKMLRQYSTETESACNVYMVFDVLDTDAF